MKIDKIIKPTKAKLKTFLLLFFGIHVLNLLLIFLVIGFWDGSLGLGIPVSFYKISCGMRLDYSTPCVTGLNIFKLFLNIFIWYSISSVVKRNK